MALGNIGSGIAKKILVSIDVMTDQAQAKLKAFERQARRSATSVSSSVTGQVGQAQSQLDQFGASARGIGNASENASQQVRGINDRIATFGKDAKFASDMAKTFRMDMLSVMFAGMQLMAVFGGMIGQMLKFTGASDALGAAMKSVLLPVTMLLQPLLISFAEFMMNLSKTQKLVLGVATVLLALTGLVAFVGAQIVMLSGALAGLTIAGAAVSTVLGVIAGAIGIVAAGFMIGAEMINQANRKITDDMGFLEQVFIRVMKSFKQIIQGGITVLKGFMNFIIGVFTGNWKKAWKGVEQVIKGFKKQVDAVFGDLVRGILRSVSSLASDISSKAKKVGSNLITSIAEGIKNAPDAIMNAIKDVAPDWVIDVMSSAGGAISGGIESVTDSTGSVISVNDFVMTPSGQVLKTAPDDFLFGTKTPGALAGGGGGQVTINIDAEVASDIDIRDLADEIEERMDRRTGGRSNLGNRKV